ncbi:DUF952 domain-containing protein [Sphingomonas sp. AOB5]|uniref:DUF952 domain-containing protein n=1 Tax=Sphingomonas sp. AOB5 TaxID=3034017 RepID=UPI0023F96AA9|nr:DUF952 domain-containing protein [Sphingomonas sp. AOB5]MDF7774507.1 DUF952 domain-containing protein [Sphingomonas sp. AOB5]
METTAYKILSDDEMEKLEHDGMFAGAPVDLADGYVHLSTCTQLQGTVDKHFAERQDLWIAAVDLEALGDAVKWEVSRGGELFPHLYAPLPLSAVTAYSPIHREADGTVRLPVAG